MCNYAFYQEEEESRPQIYCKLNNQRCLFSKFCVNQNRYIHKEGVENCYMAKMADKKEIPSGAYRVRFVKKGYLYVELNVDKVVKILNTLGVEDTDYVYVNEINGQYKISLQPFEATQKKTTNRKKK
jgi:hypothetical protein